MATLRPWIGPQDCVPIYADLAPDASKKLFAMQVFCLYSNVAKAHISELEAIGLALAAYTSWVLADTSLKIVGSSNLPPYEAVAGIGLAIAAFTFVYAASRRRLTRLWPSSPTRQVFRSLLDVANTTGVIIALRHLPLPLFYILVFAAPMMTAILAAVFLGESLTWKKSIAILTGFLGVVVAINPFSLSRTGNAIGFLACFVCVCAFSINVVWSRVLTQAESPESLTFFSGIVLAAAGLLSALIHPVPIHATQAAAMLSAALFCVLGSLCFFVALRHAHATTVTQFHYSQLFTGTILAYLIWHDTLTPAMFAGAILVIAAGIYTAANSRTHGRKIPLTTGEIS